MARETSRQRFYTIELLFTPEARVASVRYGANIMEHWLRWFFGVQLTGRDLAEELGALTIEVRVLKDRHKAEKLSPQWWEHAFAVKRIIDHDKALAS